MHWLTQPYIDLPYVARLLYGRGSRLHTRKLQDRLGGRFPFQRWELDRLEEIREEMISTLTKRKGQPVPDGGAGMVVDFIFPGAAGGCS